jgi:NAD(P)-dependent dehydrogenase (short-subunit alcohol dehydrogenase family)
VTSGSLTNTAVAVVTGAASGFGLALSREAAVKGMAVAMLDVDVDRARTEAGTLSRALGVDAFGVEVDVTDEAAVDAAVAIVRERRGRADLVVSNVGVQLFGAVERLTDKEWQWLLDVNVIGSARVARLFLPLLRASPAGRLAFTTSSSVLDPASRLGAYQASKFAVWGLAETLTLELASDQITVSVIFPSGMLTRHLETSAALQPVGLRRPIGSEEDLMAMTASNPAMAAAVASPEQAAAGVLDALLRGERYVMTHGDLVDAIERRWAELVSAAAAAR